MNTERPTPRTNAEAYWPACNDDSDRHDPQGSSVDADFARKLERELDSAWEIIHQHQDTIANQMQWLAQQKQELAEAREELARLKAGPNNAPRKTVIPRDYSEIIDHLQRCQNAEDDKFGDMAHNYFEQAITAITDLEALVIDLTTHQTHPHPEPLPRPDGPGWWWRWIPGECMVSGKPDWIITYIGEHDLPDFDTGTVWLPATPPPAPKKEGEG